MDCDRVKRLYSVRSALPLMYADTTLITMTAIRVAQRAMMEARLNWVLFFISKTIENYHFLLSKEMRVPNRNRKDTVI